MEKPYRFLKKLQKWGHSVGITIPKVWFKFKRNDNITQVWVEVYSNEIRLIPIRERK